LLRSVWKRKSLWPLWCLHFAIERFHGSRVGRSFEL